MTYVCFETKKDGGTEEGRAPTEAERQEAGENNGEGQSSKSRNRVDELFNGVGKRLEYVTMFASAFGISNAQRKIGKKLGNELKLCLRETGGIGEKFDGLTNHANSFMEKLLGDDAGAPISTLMNRVP